MSKLCTYCGREFPPILQAIDPIIKEALESCEKCVYCCQLRLENPRVLNEMLHRLQHEYKRYGEMTDMEKAIIQVVNEFEGVEYSVEPFGDDGRYWKHNRVAPEWYMYYRVKEGFTVDMLDFISP